MALTRGHGGGKAGGKGEGRRKDGPCWVCSGGLPSYLIGLDPSTRTRNQWCNSLHLPHAPTGAEESEEADGRRRCSVCAGQGGPAAGAGGSWQECSAGFMCLIYHRKAAHCRTQSTRPGHQLLAPVGSPWLHGAPAATAVSHACKRAVSLFSLFLKAQAYEIAMLDDEVASQAGSVGELTNILTEARLSEDGKLLMLPLAGRKVGLKTVL